MSSYRQILYHIIFGTKYRKHVITAAFQEELYKYVGGIIKNKNCTVYQINGYRDHIHILSDLHPSVALADFVKDIKVASSIWLKNSELFPLFEGWAEGYGAFTYAYRDKKMISGYIKNQEAHHRKVSFKQEYVKFLNDFGVVYDERFI